MSRRVVAPSSRFDRVKRGCDALIIGVSSKIPLAALSILVNTHERCACEVRYVVSDAPIGFVVVDAFDGPADIEIADFPSVPIGIEQYLKIAVIVYNSPK